MKMQMKEKGIDEPLDYTDLDLYKGSDPLPRKFKFPDMKKYSGTEDPHLHLKQYVTYLSVTELTNAQITKQFPLSLEGAPIRWYYNLESSVQNDWKELCAAFIQQYGLNTPMDVSLRDLQNVKQKFNEYFSEYLTRWREKLSLMKHRPAESDQLTIVMERCVPMLSRKLRDLGIKNFKELHRFGVQKEFNLAQDKKFFSGRQSTGRESIRSSSTSGPSHNIQINAV